MEINEFDWKTHSSGNIVLNLYSYLCIPKLYHLSPLFKIMEVLVCVQIDTDLEIQARDDEEKTDLTIQKYKSEVGLLRDIPLFLL